MSAREYAQKVDRFKFHRVVKLLRQMEQKALDQLTLDEEVEKQDTLKQDLKEEEDASFVEQLSENKVLSVILAAILGILLFFIEMVLSSDTNDE